MKKVLTFVGLALCLAACGCTRTGGDIPEKWPWNDPDADNLPWTEITDGSFGTLPEGVRLYRSPEILNGKKAVAYIATADLSKVSFHVWGLNDPELDGSEDALRTPGELFQAAGSPVLVMNGGYFYTDSGINYPASLAVEDGTLLSPNINYASEDWVTLYYPTKAAFIQHRNGSLEAAWTYFADADHHYLYQIPAENAYGDSPKPIPDGEYPEQAAAFEARTAIGAGPVLLKGGELRNTWRYECLPGDYDTNCAHPDPRTAIGATADGRLVLFVCEGREMTEGVKGYSTEDVAKLLKEFGCVEAINLDGGGSSCLLVNGNETILPSDGAQRSVGSCIYIK